jgi:hypothetical protein
MDLVKLIKNNWNPLNDTYNEIKLNPNSNVAKCVTYWLLKRKSPSQSEKEKILNVRSKYPYWKMRFEAWI